jgi:hypothetical protein
MKEVSNMRRKSSKSVIMLNQKVVQNALRKTWTPEGVPGSKSRMVINGMSSVISRLIYDIFGGEILKTHKKKNWHFYNRIDGELVDFTRSEMAKSAYKNHFEDIVTTPGETDNYFAQEDYLVFFMRFIRSFEEIVGLRNYRMDTSKS